MAAFFGRICPITYRRETAQRCGDASPTALPWKPPQRNPVGRTVDGKICQTTGRGPFVVTARTAQSGLAIPSKWTLPEMLAFGRQAAPLPSQAFPAGKRKPDEKSGPPVWKNRHPQSPEMYRPSMNGRFLDANEKNAKNGIHPPAFSVCRSVCSPGLHPCLTTQTRSHNAQSMRR